MQINWNLLKSWNGYEGKECAYCILWGDFFEWHFRSFKRPFFVYICCPEMHTQKKKKKFLPRLVFINSHTKAEMLSKNSGHLCFSIDRFFLKKNPGQSIKTKATLEQWNWNFYCRAILKLSSGKRWVSCLVSFSTVAADISIINMPEYFSVQLLFFRKLPREK